MDLSILDNETDVKIIKENIISLEATLAKLRNKLVDQTAITRYSWFPIKDEIMYKFYKQQEVNMWSADEISFAKDKDDFYSIPLNQQVLLSRVFSFFVPGDGLVNNNLIHRFLLDCTDTEEVAMFGVQIHIENVHAETYSQMFYTIFSDDEVTRLHKEAEESVYMMNKIRFLEKWTGSNRSFPERLLAFACVEGICFSVLFAVIFYFRSRGIMPGVTFSNGLISEDESLHADVGCYMHKKYGGVKQDIAHQIVDEAYQVELGFIDWLVGSGVEDLDPAGFKEYLGAVSDCLLHKAGYGIKYKTKNPFTWLDDISLLQKINFFEVKGSSYTRRSLTDAVNWRKRTRRDGVVAKDLYKNIDEVEF